MLHSEPTVRTRCFRAAALWLICFPGLALGQSTFTHVHLRVPDAWAAAHWYHTLVDGNLRVAGESGMGAVRQANGSISTMFDEPRGRTALPSAGSAIDHFGFTVDDVDATVEKARSMGATIDTEPRDGTTIARIAYIVDPWGTRMELLEDPDYPGMNHVHLMVNDADDVRGLVPGRSSAGNSCPSGVATGTTAYAMRTSGSTSPRLAEEVAPSRTPVAGSLRLSDRRGIARFRGAHCSDRLSGVPDQAQSTRFGLAVVRGSRRNPHRDFLQRECSSQIGGHTELGNGSARHHA